MLRALALVFGFSFVAGCGGSGDSLPPLLPVQGKITVDGKALSLGTVCFRPDKQKKNESTLEASAEIKPDGTYELYTKGKLGAPAGHYKVTVIAQETPDSSNPLKAKSYVSKMYSDPTSTPTLIEVSSSSKPGQYDFEVKSK